jgi:2-methylisocitrate lyase-like PEP mutase family enzyme
MAKDTTGSRQRFQALHESGTFVIPNPWDVASARVLEALGAKALATTSSGFAATLGKRDQHVTADELVEHVAALTDAVEIPVSVDAERMFADDPDGVSRVAERLAEAGAAGFSIEDYDPATGAIDPIELATARVEAAASVAQRHGIVLTGRCEAHLYGDADLGETIERLAAYRDAGAGCVFAPGLQAIEDIERVVRETGTPVNVLALGGVPPVPELAAAGVRRISTGGALAWAALGALQRAFDELTGPGTSGYLADGVAADVRARAFPT